MSKQDFNNRFDNLNNIALAVFSESAELLIILQILFHFYTRTLICLKT